MPTIHTFFLVLLLDSALSLRCFQCTDPLNLNLPCEKNWEEMPIIECGGGQVCTLHVLDKPGMDIIYRNCNSRSFCDDLKQEYLNAPEVNVRQCKICEDDHCNSSITRTGSVITALVMICFGYLI